MCSGVCAGSSLCGGEDLESQQGQEAIFSPLRLLLSAVQLTGDHDIDQLSLCGIHRHNLPLVEGNTMSNYSAIPYSAYILQV